MPQVPDFSERDDTIRSNTYTTVRRRASVPHDAFAAYWRDVHGPLCSRIDGLGWYVQHHFDRVADAHLWPASAPAPLPGYVLDGAVEIGFLSADDQARFTEASSLLFGDEQNVFDETVAYDLPDGSRTLVDRQPDPVPNGPERSDRVHVHLGRADGAGDEFAATVQQVADAAVADPGVVKVRVHQPRAYDNTQPAPPAPEVDHVVPEPRTHLAVLELAFTDSLARRSFFASDAFTATVPAQQAHLAWVTAFAVSGVFTFVRDGALTTAGRRGSRVAALIEQLAAANQTDPAVDRLFVP